MTTGQNSFNCQEESDYPAADSYIYLQSLIVNRQEEAINIPKIGFKHTEESKLKMSETLKGRTSPMKGKSHSDEANKKNSEAHKGMYDGDKNPFYGKHHTEEAKQKNAQAHIGHVAWNKGKKCPNIAKAMTGKHPTEATLQKLSESHIGQVAWNKGTKGVMVSWNKGNRGCCSVETIERLSTSHKGIKPSADTIKKIIESISGENHYNWKGGISFDPYCPKFNKQLKEHIRERDNHTCQLCPCTEEENKRKLSVHHVHYDKENCKPDLITLCVKCNTKVNQNRDYWEEYFMNKLQERGLVL